MKNASFPSDPDGSNRKKRKISRARPRDPFAKPPHPLGFQYLSDERPIRATRFGAVIPSIVAKYGLGRKIGVERFQNAWVETLRAVFGESYDVESEYDELGNRVEGNDEFESYSSKLDVFLKHTRPVSFRGGVLRVEIVSNLLYQELQFSLNLLLAEIQRRLPEERIEKIKLVVK